ncbi:MAG: hypothetical protein AAGE98_16195 [Actinomycetota bacterium]
MVRARGTLLGLALLAAACGTAGGDLAIDEPTPSLFDDDEVIVAESTTTRPESIGVEQLAGAELPSPDPTAPGVAVVDGIALAIDEVVDGTWFAASPCGTVLSGDDEPRRALVVVDPAGDVRVEAHGTTTTAINHSIATILASELEAVGVASLVTRGAGDDVAASVRAAAADASGARVVVSIAVAEGDGVLVDEPPLDVVHTAADDDARRLAGLIHQSLIPVLNDLPGAWTNAAQPGVRAVLNQRGTDFYTVLREAEDQARVVVHLPALNANTVELFSSPVTTVNMAQGLADAIARHLLTDDEGDGFVAPAETVRNASTATGEPCVDPLASSTEGDG